MREANDSEIVRFNTIQRTATAGPMGSPTCDCGVRTAWRYLDGTLCSTRRNSETFREEYEQLRWLWPRPQQQCAKPCGWNEPSGLALRQGRRVTPHGLDKQRF